LDDVGHRAAKLLEAALNVLQHLLGLSADVADADELVLLVERELTGDVDETADIGQVEGDGVAKRDLEAHRVLAGRAAEGNALEGHGSHSRDRLEAPPPAPPHTDGEGSTTGLAGRLPLSTAVGRGAGGGASPLEHASRS
jgi:hypothetical protein